MMKKKGLLFATIVVLIATISCRKDDLQEEEKEISYEEIDVNDLDETTHSALVEPDYAEVFKHDEVLRFDIKIDVSDWDTMLEDLASNLGSSGRPTPGQGGTELSSFDPVWVSCSFNYKGTEWYKVGIRFKGNSSLQSTYRMGIEKYSFKLDFDQYEDEYPAISNQRFYGFKQLNLKNNFGDASFMREKVASDLFRDFGIPSPEVAFCEVYVDFGAGPVYFGLYSLVEEVDDTVIQSQFSNGDGNLYKPDGDAASFAEGTYNTSEMEKKNNVDLADYSDVEQLYNILHLSERLTDQSHWNDSLEGVLDVPMFLKWLAANTIMQNWDTYGRMTHNYYLYNNPENNLLTWIPWDNNEALQDGKMGGALQLSLNDVGFDWPLISYLIADEDYNELYTNYVREFTENLFTPERLSVIYSSYEEKIKDYAYAEAEPYSFLNSDSQFNTAVEELITHVSNRQQAVSDFIQD